MVGATLEAKSYRIAPRGPMLAFLQELRGYKGPRTVIQGLIEGPRGSAKSFNFTRFLYNTAKAFPGMRTLVVRKTRADLASTWCKTWETEVIPPSERAAIIGDASASNRTEYVLPNGSEFLLVGLDRPSKHQGANLDVVLMEELEELKWNQVQGFFGALRKFTPGLPWQLFIGLTNPGPPKHWANLKASSGLMRRVVTIHKDNPKWWDQDAQEWTEEGRAYMASLAHYTGVQYKRHVLGLWAGAEAMVWDNFDESLHVIECPKKSDGTNDYAALGCKDYLGAMDWGFTAPGSLSIYGRDGDKRLIRVAQVYKTKQQLEWWAERVTDLDQEFRLSRVMCDPSRPDAIELVNDHIAKRGLPRLCEAANNARATSQKGDLAGLDLVRWGFENDETGVPRVRFLRDALRFGIDTDLLAADLPTDTVQEIPAYTFARDAQGDVIDDRTDPDAADHGCFVAGTPVRMADGSERAIETLQPYDRVWTPNGPEAVTEAGVMGVKPTVIVSLEGGDIRCTPDHPFHVVGLGMVRSDMLASGLEVSGWANTDDERRASSMGECGAGIQTAQTTVVGTSREMAGAYTASSTSARMGQSLLGSTFTTGTAIERTTASRTSLRSTRRSTGSNTATIRADSDRTARMSSGRSASDGSAFIASDQWLSRSRTSPASVRTTASQRGGGHPASMTNSATAVCALPFSRSTATLANGCVPRRVLGVTAAAARQTYNLTVEPSHVYVAGGALVSNCDELRYACAENWKRPAAKDAKPGPFKHGTLGNILRHDEEFKRRRRVRV